MAIGVTINLIVAALHVLDLRAYLRPALQPLVGSYFSDLALPFAFYFLLCFVDDQVIPLRPSASKAALVFAAAASAECLQAAGVPALGRTFDWWDFVAYGVGVGLAMGCDRLLLTPRIRGWPLHERAESSGF